MLGWRRRRRDKNATCGGIVEGNQRSFLARQAGARDQHLHLLVVAPPEWHRRQDRGLRLAPAGALTSSVRPSLLAAAPPPRRAKSRQRRLTKGLAARPRVTAKRVPRPRNR